jgi:hypothetical protein
MICRRVLRHDHPMRMLVAFIVLLLSMPTQAAGDL